MGGIGKKVRVVSKKNLKLELFIIEALFFITAQILGLWTGIRFLEQKVFFTSLSLWDFIFVFTLGTALIIVSLKFLSGGLFFKIFFYLAVFVGSFIIFNSFMSSLYALFLASVIVLLRLVVPVVLFHNLAIVLGVAGISANLGMGITLSIALVILAVLCLYDLIAVLRTKHMVRMFENLVERGVVFSFVMPEKLKDLFVDLRQIGLKKKFLFLGTGDIAFPLIFAVSALSFSFFSSCGVIIGAFLGILFLHLIFVFQKEKQALPALPPIILFSVLGFLISLFFI